VKDLAIALKIGERDLRYCVKFFEAYPSFETALQNLSPSTKSLSWRSVIKELTDEDGCRHNETRTEVVKTTKKICQSCGKILEFKHERIPDKEESNR
ncbi:MAG: hypothetical protein KGJ90_06485, partial [Patescibacteria group bacterium]|nr:hypothetical protein [Patescibacteria group bacterium]